MNLIKQWKYLLTCLNIIVFSFLFVSFFFVLFSVLNERFYSSESLTITFGAGGIFAAVFSYYDSLNMAPAKNDQARWSLISMLHSLLLQTIYFFLSPIQNGEYESAFRSFGSSLAFSSLLFVWKRMEV